MKSTGFGCCCGCDRCSTRFAFWFIQPHTTMCALRPTVSTRRLRIQRLNTSGEAFNVLEYETTLGKFHIHRSRSRYHRSFARAPCRRVAPMRVRVASQVYNRLLFVVGVRTRELHIGGLGMLLTCCRRVHSQLQDARSRIHRPLLDPSTWWFTPVPSSRRSRVPSGTPTHLRWTSRWQESNGKRTATKNRPVFCLARRVVLVLFSSSNPQFETCTATDTALAGRTLASVGWRAARLVRMDSIEVQFLPVCIPYRPN